MKIKKYGTFNSHSTAKIIISESDAYNVFQSIYAAIISKIQKSLGKSSGWIIDSVINHTISISKYNPLARSSYIKSSEELDHLRKRLINNIQNIDVNECFKWCLVRYLNPVHRNPARITKAAGDFVKNTDFKDIKYPVKVRDVHKIEKKNSSALVFLVMKIKKNIQSMYQKKYEEKYVYSFWIEEKGKKYYLLIKDFNICMYNHIWHVRKNFLLLLLFRNF